MENILPLPYPVAVERKKLQVLRNLVNYKDQVLARTFKQYRKFCKFTFIEAINNLVKYNYKMSVMSREPVLPHCTVLYNTHLLNNMGNLLNFCINMVSWTGTKKIK